MGEDETVPETWPVVGGMSRRYDGPQVGLSEPTPRRSLQYL